MTTAPFPIVGQDPRQKFDRLAAEWEAATLLMSSVHQICMDRSYQQIIGMGAPAVPLILARLRNRPAHWFWALQAITGENAIRREHDGDMDAMAADWLSWGREHGLSAN